MAVTDQSFPTVPRPTGGFKRNRTWSRFALWAWSETRSFQVGLTAGYIALVYFGVSALIASPPSFENTSPEGYAWGWSVALVVGAVAAAIGSVSRFKWFERTEFIGANLLSATVGSYALLLLTIAYLQGDTTRIAGGAGFVALAVPIVIRTMWLWSQLLRAKK